MQPLYTIVPIQSKRNRSEIPRITQMHTGSGANRIFWHTLKNHRIGTDLSKRNTSQTQKTDILRTYIDPKFDSSNYYWVNIWFIKSIIISFYYRFFGPRFDTYFLSEQTGFVRFLTTFSTMNLTFPPTVIECDFYDY